MDPALNFGSPAGIVQAIKGSEMAVRGVRQSGGVALDVWHACRCVSILNCVNCDLAVNLNVQCRCEMGNILCGSLASTCQAATPSGPSRALAAGPCRALRSCSHELAGPQRGMVMIIDDVGEYVDAVDAAPSRAGELLKLADEDDATSDDKGAVEAPAAAAPMGKDAAAAMAPSTSTTLELLATPGPPGPSAVVTESGDGTGPGDGDGDGDGTQ